MKLKTLALYSIAPLVGLALLAIALVLVPGPEEMPAFRRGPGPSAVVDTAGRPTDLGVHGTEAPCSTAESPASGIDAAGRHYIPVRFIENGLTECVTVPGAHFGLTPSNEAIVAGWTRSGGVLVGVAPDSVDSLEITIGSWSRRLAPLSENSGSDGGLIGIYLGYGFAVQIPDGETMAQLRATHRDGHLEELILDLAGTG